MKPLLSAAAALAVIAAPASAATINTLAVFNGINGKQSYGIVADAAGTLYGSSQGGDGNGNIWKLPQGGALTSLYDFNGTGYLPKGALHIDSSGNLYGTTLTRGSNGLGTVFRVSSAGTHTELAGFGGIPGGPALPYGGVIADTSGTLYGTSFIGGSNGAGSVFSLATDGTVTTLASFDRNIHGSGPFASSLLRDASGTLFGSTEDQGPGGGGTVFKLTTDGTLSTLYATTGRPTGTLIADASGTLYGTTRFSLSGGISGGGTVFSITSAGTVTTLATFDEIIRGGLIMDASGTLFGTTSSSLSGPGVGTVFSLTKTGTLTTLASFDGSNGSGPVGSLIADALGTLYGVTQFGGGPDNAGTVFSITGSGFDVGGAVPEPASWAMLIAGFGLTGAAMRRRRRVTAVVA
jgi:uncharacterized repeat protein (TIGR03803 family)